MSTESAYGPYIPPVVPVRGHPASKAPEQKPPEPAAPASMAADAPAAPQPAASAPAKPYTPPPLMDPEMLAVLGPYVPPGGLGGTGHGRYIPPSGLTALGNALHATHARTVVPGQSAPAADPPTDRVPAKSPSADAPAASPAAHEAPAAPAAHEALEAPKAPDIPAAAAPAIPEEVPAEAAAAAHAPTPPPPAEPAADNPATEAVAQEDMPPAPLRARPTSAPQPTPTPTPQPARPPQARQVLAPDPSALWDRWVRMFPDHAAQWAQWAQGQPDEATAWARAQMAQAVQWAQWALDNPEEAGLRARSESDPAAQWAWAFPEPADTGMRVPPVHPEAATGTARTSAGAAPASAIPAAGPSVPAQAPPAAEAAGERKGGYRGGLFDQVDVPALTSFLVCAVVFVLALVWVKSVDYSRLDRPTLEDVPERIAKILMPLKPPGKAAPKRDAGRKPGREPSKGAPAAKGSESSAAARIERSRKTVTEKVEETQQRVKRVAMLSILSGKGPATQGATTASRARARAGGLVDFGGLEDKLANLEGLTKFDSKSTVNNGAPTRDEGAGALAGIDKMVKGFQNAKVGSLAKVGVMELEKPELLERNSKYTGDRSMADVGAFIAKKQNLVTMLYEERLKIDPTLEGKITVVLVIEEDGTVSSATVLRSETTLNDPDFQAELLRRIRRWIFPPSTGGPVEMKSPFVFKPA